MQMIKRIAAAAALVAAVACATMGGVVKNYVTVPCRQELPMAFSVDSIDYRKDLTRVYGTLTGTPHRSGRIDRIDAVTAAGTMTATDIEGVDFERYFQWEDDGIILLEIDFPVMKAPSEIQFTTQAGRADFHISR